MNRIRIEIEKPRHRWNPLRWIWPTRKFSYNRKTPSNWDELTLKQIRLVAKAILRVDEKQINTQLILSFINIPFRNLKYMNLSQLDEIAATLDFVFDKEKMVYNKFKTMKVGNQVLLGPSDRLGDISFSQFVFADTLFLKYSKKADPQTLRQLIATLWLPVNSTFDPANIERNAKRLDKVSEYDALICLLFYIGSRHHITNIYKHLFPKSKTQSKSKSSFSWSDTVFELVGDKPADKHKIDNLNIYFAMGWLDRKAKENKEKAKRK